MKFDPIAAAHSALGATVRTRAPRRRSASASIDDRRPGDVSHHREHRVPRRQVGGRVQAEHVRVTAGGGGVEVGGAPHAAVDVLAVADPHRGEQPGHRARRLHRLGHAGARGAGAAEHDPAAGPPVDRGDAQASVEPGLGRSTWARSWLSVSGGRGRPRSSSARSSAPPGAATPERQRSERGAGGQRGLSGATRGSDGATASPRAGPALPTSSRCRPTTGGAARCPRPDARRRSPPRTCRRSTRSPAGRRRPRPRSRPGRPSSRLRRERRRHRERAHRVASASAQATRRALPRASSRLYVITYARMVLAEQTTSPEGLGPACERCGRRWIFRCATWRAVGGQRADAVSGGARRDQPDAAGRHPDRPRLELRLSQLLRLDEGGAVTVVRGGERRTGPSGAAGPRLRDPDAAAARPAGRAVPAHAGARRGHRRSRRSADARARQPRDRPGAGRHRRAALRRSAPRADRRRLRHLRRRSSPPFREPRSATEPCCWPWSAPA